MCGERGREEGVYELCVGGGGREERGRGGREEGGGGGFGSGEIICDFYGGWGSLHFHFVLKGGGGGGGKRNFENGSRSQSSPAPTHP